MSEGALEYILINETKVDIEVSDLIDKLARIVDDKLDDYYLYEEEPYLSNDEDGESYTIYLNKDGEQGSPCDWNAIFTKSIKRLAQDMAEEGPGE